MSKPNECPKCQSEKVMRIQYGYPDPSINHSQDIYFGGCCVSDNDPIWHCEKCNWQWGPDTKGSYAEEEEEPED